jgi:hypothetical protein
MLQGGHFPLLLVGCTLLALGTIRSFSAEENVYLPIGEGIEWVMDLKVFTPDGRKLEGTGHRKVQGTIERDGKTYHRSKTWSEGISPDISYTKLCRKDSTGFYMIDERDPNSIEQKEVVLPLKVGSTWETKSDGRVLQNSVVGVETVVAGNKTFENCFHIRVQSADGKQVEDFWEAPQVGCVKSITVYPNGGKIALILREFKAPKTENSESR